MEVFMRCFHKNRMMLKHTNRIINKYLIRNDIIIDIVGNVLIKTYWVSQIDSIWNMFSKELINYSEVGKYYNKNDWKLKIEEFHKDFTQSPFNYLLQTNSPFWRMKIIEYEEIIFSFGSFAVQSCLKSLVGFSISALIGIKSRCNLIY